MSEINLRQPQYVVFSKKSKLLAAPRFKKNSVCQKKFNVVFEKFFFIIFSDIMLTSIDINPWIFLQVLFVYFYFFSFIGHCLEIIWAPIRAGIFGGEKFRPKMFTQMPLAMPYGLGAVCLILLVEPVAGKLGWIGTFIISALMMGLVEYLSALIIEKFYAGYNPYWDYSQKPFNIKGRVCLDNILLFGVVGVLFIKYILPWTNSLLLALGQNKFQILFGIAFGLFIIDFVYSFIEQFYLKKQNYSFKKNQLATGRQDEFAQRLNEKTDEPKVGLQATRPDWTRTLYAHWEKRQQRIQAIWAEEVRKFENLRGRKKRDPLLYFAKIFIYFYIFSILGHYLEVVWAPIAAAITGSKEFIPKMFFQMPLAPPYGLGVAGVILLVEPWRKRFKLNVFWTFILSAIICSIIEWLSATLIIVIYGSNPYWNYINDPFNFQGKICLSNALLFGFATTIFLFWIYPLGERIATRFTRRQIINFFWSLLAIFIIDGAYSGYEQYLAEHNKLPTPTKSLENWQKIIELIDIN